MPRFPQVSETTGELTTYVFSSARQKASTVNPDVIRLHIGDTWLDPLPGARAEDLTLASIPGLHTYAPVQGIPDLIAAIQGKVRRRTGISLDAENIQVTAGCTGAMAIACRALLNPGDEVILPSPYWPLIRGIITSVGATPVQVPVFTRLSTPNFDIEAAIEAAITPRTTAIYLNSPNNPTGAILDEAASAAIARVVAKHDLWVLSDEVYEDLYYGATPPTPVWTREDLIERTVVGHSASKAYAMAGGRIGWIHGPSHAMRSIRAVQTFHAYCANKPMQYAATHALTQGDAWLDRTRGLYRDAARRSADALNLPEPPAGTFLFFDASPWLDDKGIPAFLDRCRMGGVTMTPGMASGADFETWARLSFTAANPERLDEALRRLKKVLSGG